MFKYEYNGISMKISIKKAPEDCLPEGQAADSRRVQKTPQGT